MRPLRLGETKAQGHTALRGQSQKSDSGLSPELSVPGSPRMTIVPTVLSAEFQPLGMREVLTGYLVLNPEELCTGT